MNISVVKGKSNEQSVKRYYGTGRRKESSARVWISRGSGKVTVNGKSLDDYFQRATLRIIVDQPFAETDTVGQYDVFSTVKGGGLSGQAGAVRHGISRALDVVTNHQGEMHVKLRKSNLLTRDDRKVERKKYGLKKARRSYQYSKR